MNLLIMLLFLIILVFIISFGINRQKSLRPGRFGKYGHGSKAKWILSAYGLILLASVIMLYLIPNKGFLNQNENSGINLAQKQEIPPDIYSAAKEHRLDKTEGIYANKKYKFPFNEKRLDITSSTLQNGNLQILAERKGINDNIIEVIEYSTKSEFYGIDFTNKIKSPKIQLVKNELEIIKPEGFSIKLTSFNNEFTLTQFSNNKNNQQDYFSNIVWGQRVLYIRIPQNVEILKNKLNVQFINEELKQK